MKWIFSFLLLLISLLASDDGFLEPEKAFVVNITEIAGNIDINVKLDKTIYLYDDKVEVLINKTNVTKKVFTKKPIDHDGFIVHMGEFIISVPKAMIKEVGGENPYTVTFNYQGCSVDGLCYAPLSNSYSGSFGAVAKEEPKVPSNESKDETSSIADILSGGNIFLILATFFGFGLLLSLTPCIFPMVPILSSIIVQHLNQDGGKMSAKKGFLLSLVYVLSMSAAYTIAGVMAGVFGANIQAMLQNPVVLVIFSGVFVALAFSLFGYYSLELPQSFQNKINSLTGGSKNQGVAGVAVMGFLSALIVGPCVAPPLAGALMYIGQTGDAVLGGLALFVMSLGLGMPLLLVGAGAGKYMPKPGGWMETVSKAFGVVMLALAIFMLDRLLPEMVTFGLYALLCFGSAYYLFKNGNKVGKIIAGLLIVIGGYAGYLSATVKSGGEITFQYIKTSAELDEILKTTDKPVIVDFWASWCVSCKELEKITYADETVKEAMTTGYVLLKVDVTHNTADDKELMKRFGVFGPPALIFFDKDGQELPNKRIVGYKNPKEFMEILNK